jgi:hypothetical protein
MASATIIGTNPRDRVKEKRMKGELRLIKESTIDYIEIIRLEDEYNIDPTDAVGKSEEFIEKKYTKGHAFVFMIRGNVDVDPITKEHSPYAGGYYIGKLLLNNEHPFKAGDIFMITPNGRFVHSKKICMDNTAFHQNDSSGGMKAGWNVVTILLGFMSIWNDDETDGISFLCKGQFEHHNTGGWDIEHDGKVIHLNLKDLNNYRLKCAKESVVWNYKHYPEYLKLFKKFYPDYKHLLPESFKPIDDDDEPACASGST